jgi:NAD(P)-dependent dehydrogenase (short-subunit alcohol dehydrogenase family)
MKLDGKIGLVIGAGRGIGRAAAIALAREGADLALAARSVDEVRSAAEEASRNGTRALAVRADIARPKEVDELFIRFSSEFGRLDFLVHAAAVLGPLKPLARVRSREFEETVQTNLIGAFYASRRATEFMVEKREGAILHLTSGLSNIVMPCFGAYGISKAGLDHLVRYLAAELKESNVRVNALDPGSVDTPMQEEVRSHGAECMEPEAHDIFVKMKEQNLLRDPEEVAHCIVALVSDGASHLTGHIGTLQYYRDLGVSF